MLAGTVVALQFPLDILCLVEVGAGRVGAFPGHLPGRAAGRLVLGVTLRVAPFIQAVVDAIVRGLLRLVSHAGNHKRLKRLLDQPLALADEGPTAPLSLMTRQAEEAPADTPLQGGFRHVEGWVPQKLVTATGPNPLPR